MVEDPGPKSDEQSLAKRIASLIPSADDGRMWENRYAALLERAADMDDVTFARIALEGAEAIKDVNAFAAAFYGGHGIADPGYIDPDDVKRSGLRLANIPRDLRSAFLKAVAAKLRGETPAVED